MHEPVILAVDDDAAVLDQLRSRLSRRYGEDYRVIAEASAAAALDLLEDIRARGGDVALLIADLWMPAMSGVDFLVRAHDLHPTARRALLFDVGDTSASDLVQRSMALGRIDDYMPKALAAVLDIPPEKIYTRNIARHGHCFGADPFINFLDALQQRRLVVGDRVMLVSAGLGANCECPR